MSRAHEFIRLYNELDDYLRKLVGFESRRGFMERVEEAARSNPTLRRVREELREYAELRNAIVHYRSFPDQIIAEPSEEALANLARICERVMRPRRLIPDFQREVRSLAPDEALLPALRYLGEQGYSQAPVLLASVAGHVKLNLLSAEGLARWLLAQAAHDNLNLKEARVADVLPYEHEGSFTLMRPDNTVDEARDAFERALQAKRPRLRCILITPDGRPGARVMGIITPGDLLED